MDFINKVDPWSPGAMSSVTIEYDNEVHRGHKCPLCGGTDIAELETSRGHRYVPGRIFTCNDSECNVIWINGFAGKDESLPVVYGIMAIVDGFYPDPAVKDGKPSHTETATNLVLDVLRNDKKAYHHWLDTARKVMEISHLPRVVQDGDWTPEQYELFTMEDALKIHYERNNPFERFTVNASTRRGDKGPGEGWLIYPGLMSFALSLVDWRQVGGYFLLTAKELKTY